MKTLCPFDSRVFMTVLKIRVALDRCESITWMLNSPRSVLLQLPLFNSFWYTSYCSLNLSTSGCHFFINFGTTVFSLSSISSFFDNWSVVFSPFRFCWTSYVRIISVGISTNSINGKMVTTLLNAFFDQKPFSGSGILFSLQILFNLE